MESKIIFGQMIKHYRKLNDLSMEEFGNKIGKTKSTISKWESSNRYPKIEEVEAIANFFGVSVETLLFGSNSNRDNLIKIYDDLQAPRQTKVYNFAERQLEEQNRDNVVDFPERHVVTGRGSAAGSALYVDDADVRHDVLPASMVPSGADELVEINGHSMEPLINNGEKVYIRYQPTVENGEIAIVRIENEGVTCKRVYVDGDTVTLKSENEEFSDMLFAPSEVTVLGKVLLK